MQLCDLKLKRAGHYPPSKHFKQYILVSTRRRRWWPFHFFQIPRPSLWHARSAALRTAAPCLVSFHGLLFLPGGKAAVLAVSSGGG